MTATLYGIKNCDTVRRARKWLEERDIDYRFHDFRGDGLDRQLLQHWMEKLGWEALINKRSATWKTLSATQREQLTTATAVTTLLTHPTLIKRPVLVTGEEMLVGFDEKQYQTLFTQHTL